MILSQNLHADVTDMRSGWVAQHDDQQQLALFRGSFQQLRDIRRDPPRLVAREPAHSGADCQRLKCATAWLSTSSLGDRFLKQQSRRRYAVNGFAFVPILANTRPQQGLPNWRGLPSNPQPTRNNSASPMRSKVRSVDNLAFDSLPPWSRCIVAKHQGGNHG
jgi:hypothetical protein